MIYVNKVVDYNTLGKEIVRRLSFFSFEKFKNKNYFWVFQECRRVDQFLGSWNIFVFVFNIFFKCNYVKFLEGIVFFLQGFDLSVVNYYCDKVIKGIYNQDEIKCK